MTREQIAAEKVALQKALLHYESIHGRPVSRPPPPLTRSINKHMQSSAMFLLRDGDLFGKSSVIMKAVRECLCALLTGLP